MAYVISRRSREEETAPQPTAPKVPDLIPNDRWKKMSQAPKDGTHIHVMQVIEGVPTARFYDVVWTHPQGHAAPRWFVVGSDITWLREETLVAFTESVGRPDWI